jgi:hypothetical protein
MKIDNPFSIIREPINHDIYERFIQKFDADSIADQIFEDVNDRIKKNIESMTPDLLVNFNELYIKLTDIIKTQQKVIHDIEKKFKSIIQSSCLTEDVYKIRDEMKVIKKKIDEVNLGFKNFAKCGEILDGKDE